MDWIDVRERMPEHKMPTRGEPQQEFIVRVQDIRGGCLRNSFHYEVCECRHTMLDRHYFSIQQPGIVTHWAVLERVEDI